MAMPSNMSPPGELTCTVTGFLPMARRAPAMRLAVKPPPDHISSPITSKIVIVPGSSDAAASGCSAHFASTSEGASHWKFCGRWKVAASGSLRRLIDLFLFSRAGSAGRVRRVVEGAALPVGARVAVLEFKHIVGREHAPLQRLHIRLPPGLDVALDQRRAVELGVKVRVVVGQVDAHRLFPHRQVVFEGVGDEPDGLLLDTAAPARRL